MKRVIVISAVNIRDGGALSILMDSLSTLQSDFASDYRVIALVHNIELFSDFQGVELIEFPNSTRSYLHRLYYEYYVFNKLSKQWSPYLWLSLHDMTPNVETTIQAVYCHNPLPFYKLNFQELLIEPKLYIFSLLYQYAYQINIKNNNKVIVQQNWLREAFVKRFNLSDRNVIVAYPDIKPLKKLDISKKTNQKYQFIFPVLPRVFKNMEIIIDSIRLLEKQDCPDFEVMLTIDNTENSYAKYIIKYARGVNSIKFLGRLSRAEIYDLYNDCHCLLFPSRLETWGLPITEFKAFNKPILAADLPYAHETIGNYDLVSFFDPNDPATLARLMYEVMTEQFKPKVNKAISVSEPYCDNWVSLFSVLLDEGAKNSSSRQKLK